MNAPHAPTKEGVRRLLDSWQFWVGIAYFGLACVVVALWVNFGRVATDQRRTAIVVAERGADIEAQYQVCLRSIPVLAQFNRFVKGVQSVDSALLRNSIASHEATDPASALYQAQIANIARLRSALGDTIGLTLPTVNRQACEAARDGRHAS